MPFKGQATLSSSLPVDGMWQIDLYGAFLMENMIKMAPFVTLSW